MVTASEIRQAVNEALEETRAVVDSHPAIDVMAIELAECAGTYSYAPEATLSYVMFRWNAATMWDTIDIDRDWVNLPMLEGTADGPEFF